MTIFGMQRSLPEEFAGQNGRKFEQMFSMTSGTGQYELRGYRGSFAHVVIPPDVNLICENAFYSCKSMRSIEIPSNVGAIEKHAFDFCENLESVTIFYYIYAVLQSKGYISAYQDNLSKEMPRIPFLKGFSEYVRIGKALADIHLHYEKPVNPEELRLTVEIDKPDYTVQQMKFPKEGKKALKHTISYNEYIRISNIPERVYDYIINGKSAVEWIMERYAITTDKASGITDNPNDYGDEKYIFNLLISVMTVSLKTLDLIDSMPKYEEI